MNWIGYAAAAWALLFAASNVYWGLGGRQAVPLPDPEAAFADPTFRLINLVAVGGKAGMALVALATVWAQGTGQTGLPRRLLLIVAYGLGIGMTLYGGLGLIVDTLRLLGVLAVSPESGPSLRWHVFLWDPWWIAGGLLFLGAARNLQASAPTLLKTLGVTAARTL
jgi:hypothetical protein